MQETNFIYPPIITNCHTQYSKSYDIIDGIHRLNALKQCGKTKVWVYCGIKEEQINKDPINFIYIMDSPQQSSQSSQKILVQCPICHQKKNISIMDFVIKEGMITNNLILAGKVCEHTFLIYIDSHGSIRGTLKIHNH